MKKPERVEPGQPWRFRCCSPCLVAAVGDNAHGRYFDTVTFADGSPSAFARDMLTWDLWEYLGASDAAGDKR